MKTPDKRAAPTAADDRAGAGKHGETVVINACMRSLAWQFLLIFAFAAGAGSGDAMAATMTFTGIPGGCGPGQYDFVEDGIRASFVSAHSNPDRLHMDDAGTACPSVVEFTTGTYFAAQSFDLHPLGPSDYCAEETATEPETCGIEYANVRLVGYDGAREVASAQFWMGDTDSTYLFGAAFHSVDRLVLAAVFPPNGDIAGRRFFCTDAPCAHFEVDNLAVLAAAPVPVPPALVLMLSGLASLVYARRRRR